MSMKVVRALAQRKGRLLVTTDQGFGHYRSQPHDDILVLRPRQPDWTRVRSAVTRAKPQ